MTRAPVLYAKPSAADIVLCRFPGDLRDPRPGPKPRPAIILRVLEPDAHAAVLAFRVQVCYATSNRARLYPHEFEIVAADHPTEFLRSGLSADTKFSLRQQALLPYTDEWFAVPRFPRFGQTPKLGELHPQSMPRLMAAYRHSGR